MRRRRTADGTANRRPIRIVGMSPRLAAAYDAARPRPRTAPPSSTLTVGRARRSSIVGETTLPVSASAVLMPLNLCRYRQIWIMMVADIRNS